MTPIRLLWPTRLGLFATAYLPLFVIFALVQIDAANEALGKTGAGWSKRTAFEYLTVPIVLVVLGLAGAIVLGISVRKMSKQVLGGGTRVIVQNIEDKGSEALAYVSSYIIPFLFEDLNGWPRSLALVLLLLVVGTVYLNSTMLAVNPLLRWFGVGLYQADVRAVTAKDVPAAKVKKTMLMIREPMVGEGGEIAIEAIGPKLAFAAPISSSLA